MRAFIIMFGFFLLFACENEALSPATQRIHQNSQELKQRLDKAENRIKNLEEQQAAICARCNGTGKIICGYCEGKGMTGYEYVNGRWIEDFIPCPRCQRRGWLYCPDCEDSGKK